MEDKQSVSNSPGNTIKHKTNENTYLFLGLVVHIVHIKPLQNALESVHVNRLPIVAETLKQLLHIPSRHPRRCRMMMVVVVVLIVRVTFRAAASLSIVGQRLERALLVGQMQGVHVTLGRNREAAVVVSTTGTTQRRAESGRRFCVQMLMARQMFGAQQADDTNGHQVASHVVLFLKRFCVSVKVCGFAVERTMGEPKLR